MHNQKRQRSVVGHLPASEALLAFHTATLAVLVRPILNRGADHHVVKVPISGQRLRRHAGDVHAHQPPPGDRQRDHGVDRIARHGCLAPRSPSPRGSQNAHGMRCPCLRPPLKCRLLFILPPVTKRILRMTSAKGKCNTARPNYGSEIEHLFGHELY